MNETKWQPIETAPKDGTWVDLWVKPDPMLASPHRIVWCYWGTLDKAKSKYDTTPRKEGWIGDYTEYMGMRKTDYLEPYHTVTHWIPIPKDPETDNKTNA
jgi:hypothetical protein